MSENKIALITGANKGIGYETAAQLAALGMTVVIGARDTQRREEAAKALRVQSVALDVTDPASAQSAAEQVEERFGRLDVLVNNAGITGGSYDPPSKIDLDIVRQVFETNYFGVIAVTNAMLPLLLRSPAPRIVNMSSTVGSLASMTDAESPLAAMPASATYPVSKTALNALTVQYAKEFAKDGILINAACPGYCDTDLTNHAGFRTAAQGAAIAVKLATLGADGPTGEFFDDNGRVAW
ncbi:NAD(P)-dependent dehydrogenase (short-subunit alcohol dehydrogenase family) [Kibdelosporangium banguiense]|uniref:NAD(P)-dependent dehydrogenase (Short-subunit alcohol dehydrogenase family) n=1 Tax=Kibdelosporangium banguiense TaxID=1365924 RepID=A0ABS4TKV1_9PSEU|nr:SDR family oxidoreductase [Kibdelosporangium banguiense]MBP2324548.1 NAD(P)-dependent dehydrogenase (short-subunit alcohol dehydrogenase family) [Kibdelosporangium banguiense]